MVFQDDHTVDEVLADKWTDVIDERENMTRQQKNQQEAIWELLSTEYKYVGKIRVILQVTLLNQFLNGVISISTNIFTLNCNYYS